VSRRSKNSLSTDSEFGLSGREVKRSEEKMKAEQKLSWRLVQETGRHVDGAF
jgi:hypothetical protein